jgi:glycosyltransferase involved in cell wall biosynthesis
LNNLRFVGLLKREDVDAYYEDSDCLLFPSKVESWGLPITEAKEYGKSILVAALPYAWESVGKYDKAKFFDPDDVRQLAEEMKNFIQQTMVYDETEEIKYTEPFTQNWDELIRYVLS